MEGKKERVEMLLKNGIGPNPDKDLDMTPMFAASASGHKEIVEMLITAGAVVDTPVRTNASPLWIASGTGHTEIVQILINAGANVNMKNKNDSVPSTPLAVAVMSGHTDVVRVLLNNEADMNVKFDNIPIIIWAKSLDRDEIVRLLINARANIEDLRPESKRELLPIKEEIIKKKLMGPLVAERGLSRDGTHRLFRHGQGSKVLGSEFAKNLYVGGKRKSKRKTKRKTRKTKKKLGN